MGPSLLVAAAIEARAVWIWRLAQHLMHLGDQVPIGPKVPRLTVAASALCATDRLLPSKYPTQGQVAEAASTVVPTSTDRIARFGLVLFDAYVDEHGANDPGIGLDEERAPCAERGFPRFSDHHLLSPAHSSEGRCRSGTQRWLR